MKHILLFLLITFSTTAKAYQLNTLQKKIQIADSLLNEKAYQLSAQSWNEIIHLTSSQDPQFSLYESKRFFCQANLLQLAGDYTNAIKNYHSALQLLNTYSSSENDQYKIEIYSGLYHSLAFSGDWDKALTIGNEGLRLFNNSINKKIRADYIYDLGYINDRLDNYTQAIALYQQSIALYETMDNNKNFDLGLAYNNLATVYKKIGFFSERLTSFEQAQKYWERDPHINPTYLITLYGNMLKLYIEYGDTRKSKELFLALNDLSNEKLLASDTVNKYRLSVLYYTFSKQLKKAEKQIEEFTSFFSNLTPKEKNQYSHHYLAALIDLGDEYIGNKLDFKATKILEQALQISHTYQQPYYRMLTYTKMTKLVTDKEDYTSAIGYLDKALTIHKQSSIGRINIVNILIKKANLQVKQCLLPEANRTIREALTTLAGKTIHTPTDIKSDTFKEQHSSFYVMALKNTADFYKKLFYQTQQNTDAHHAHYLYNLAAEVFGLYYQNGEYNTNLNYYNKSINEGIYEMHTILKIPLSEKVLTKIEANNSQVLRNEFERKHYQFLAVDKSMLSQRNLLQFKLKKLQATESETIHQQRLQDTIRKLDAAISAKDPLLQSFYKDAISLQTIQHHLQDDELLIKYFVGFQSVYAIGFSKQSTYLYRLGETDTLEKNLSTFYKALQNPKKNTLSHSRELYRQLMQPIRKELAHYKTLSIIPDDALHYLPFETLANETGFLLNTHKIQYSNSLTLWYFLKTNPHPSKEDKNLLATFAPQYEAIDNDKISLRGDRFKKLEGAKLEAENITATLDGDLFLNEEASIENFMAHTSNYKIYHLAMHSVLDTEEYTKSSLIFNDNKFFDFSSLYSLYFPADLVVLSACNTGVGELAAGEGLLSLSKALTYAGVRSSVYSLWEVPDRETSEIMVSFYQYLSKGEDKATALAQSKRDFIQKNPYKSHPYYWAGFVISGDTVSVVPSNSYLLGYLLTGGIIFSITIFYIRKKRIRKSV